MTAYRRSSYCFALFIDRAKVDVSAFLHSTIRVERQAETIGISLLTGRTRSLDASSLALLQSLDAGNWIPCDRLDHLAVIDETDLNGLVNDGFLLSDASDPAATDMRNRDQALRRVHWSPYQALAYVMSRWTSNERLDTPDDELPDALDSYEELVRAYGAPPGHFHELDHCARLPLAEPDAPDEMIQALLARRTGRGFVTTRALPATVFSTLLRYAFGCFDRLEVTGNYTVLRKTSPSGGALHPIEAYPLVLNVEGLSTGIYHYRVEHHDLELLEALEPDQARDQATQMLAGQYYFSSACVVIFLTARFERNFWKYRSDHKALGVVQMDAAHLSQTFQILGHTLGLRTFVTGAIIDELTDSFLRLPYLEEGTLLAIGCGYPSDAGVPGGIPFDGEIG